MKLAIPVLLWRGAAVCLAAGPALAQTSAASHVMEMRDEIPPDRLPPPRPMTGIGNSHMQITAKPEAQMWFDQGLNLLHDFWDYESARAFEQAVRVDPECAICFWGLYKAESFYHSTAQGYAGQAMAKAVSLKDRASARERMYIEATAAHEEAMRSPRPGPKLAEELDLWRKLASQYPEDTQARIFLSQAVGQQKETLDLLESVFRDRPDDSAANHYYIHALEASDHPERALHSAEILAGLAPASGHMVHMPGHIFFRLGDYARAEQAFAASLQADESYMKEQHVAPDDDWNYVHNIMYGVANLMEEGKLRAATELSGKLTRARGESESTLYIYSARDSISRLNPRLPVALRTADWPQVAGLLRSAPPAGQPNLDFLARQLAEFAAGMRAIENRNPARAEESSARFDAELWRMSRQAKDSQPAGGMPGMAKPAAGPPKTTMNADALLPPILNTLSIMSLELRASLLAARKQMEEARALFARAQEDEKALGYREPPNYIRPVGETEGAAMMAIGAWSEAMAAYERALKERPRSGLVLYAMGLACEKSGDSAAAAKQYADFLMAWKDADPFLPQIRHAKAWLAHLHG